MKVAVFEMKIKQLMFFCQSVKVNNKYSIFAKIKHTQTFSRFDQPIIRKVDYAFIIVSNDPI